MGRAEGEGMRRLLARGIGSVRRLVEAVESEGPGPGGAAAVLAGVIALRTVLEIAVADNPAYSALAGFVQYPLAYLAPFAALTVVLAFWARVSPARVARLMTLAWLLTLGPPLADLLLHAGRAHVRAIGYLHADPSDLGWIFLHFFDFRRSLVGTTLGIRLEALAALLLAAIYVRMKGGSVGRSAAAAVSVYAVSFFFFALPVIALGLYRLRLPGTTMRSFYEGEGVLIRENPAAGADATPILWLVPILGATLLAWRTLERRSPEPGWLAGGSPSPRLPGAGWIAAAACASGIVAARWLHLPAGPLHAASAWDLLAGAAGPLGCGLAAAAAVPRRASGDPAAGRVAAAAGAGALAAALG
ncbi:MAG: hypothetical protein D6718_11680, partial [Acidobacteria bacterium]